MEYIYLELFICYCHFGLLLSISLSTGHIFRFLTFFTSSGKMHHLNESLQCKIASVLLLYDRYRVLQIVLREKNFRQLPRFSFINVNIFGVSTLYMLVFLACSILSMAFRGYFYCVCLLFIIFTSDILQRVLRAVTKHG